MSELPQDPVPRFSTLKVGDHRDVTPENTDRSRATKKHRRGSSVRWWAIYRRLWGFWDPQRCHILGSVRHEGVNWRTTRPLNELSRYELMISTEPMNPGIATERKFVSACDRCVVYEPATGRHSHLFREAQARAGFQTFNPARAPGS